MAFRRLHGNKNARYGKTRVDKRGGRTLTAPMRIIGRARSQYSKRAI